MNKDKRKRLSRAVELLTEAKNIIEEVMDEEQGGFDNMSEWLQASERGQQMEEAIDNMSSAIDSIDEAAEYIDEASM